MVSHYNKTGMHVFAHDQAWGWKVKVTHNRHGVLYVSYPRSPQHFLKCCEEAHALATKGYGRAV